MGKSVKKGDEKEAPFRVGEETVVVVGSQPVFSHKDKDICELKRQQLVQDKLRAGEDMSNPENMVQLAEVHFSSKDDREGTLVFA